MNIPALVPSHKKQVDTYPIDNTQLSLTQAQKAAVIIAILEPEVAGPLVERVGDKHLRAIARAMARLSEVPVKVIEKIIEEFVSNLSDEDGALKGGYNAAQTLLARYVSDDNLTRLMEDVDGPGGRSVWEKLDNVDETNLANYVDTLHSQAACILLTKINPDKAARIIEQFDDDKGRNIILRMSNPLKVSRETLSILSKIIERDFLKPMRNRGKSRDPAEVISGLINSISAKKRENIIEYLIDTKPDVGNAVKKSMLSFSDLSDRLPANAIAIIAREADVSTLVIAMKYGQQNAPSVVEYFFANLSKRMVQDFEEKMAGLKQIKLKEAEAAQVEITAIVRRLVDDGTFTLKEIQNDEEDSDDYV